jgi:hypothetical protein
MPKALAITRADYTAAELREAAARSNDADATRRMLAPALSPTCKLFVHLPQHPARKLRLAATAGQASCCVCYISAVPQTYLRRPKRLIAPTPRVPRRATVADGAAITGAQVTVTFYMPAMPAMGMAAMRNVTTLSEKGGGIYEGPGEVQMGGTWQVNVVATKAGQTIAQKQVSVTAEGGM